MTALLHKLLNECVSCGEAIEVHRDGLPSSSTVVGIVIAWSRSVVILEVLDDGVRDGVTAIRTKDISSVKRNSRQLMVERAVAGVPAHTLPPSSTLSMTAALINLQNAHDVVECDDESGSPRMSWIGRSIELDDDFVYLDALSPASRMERCRWLLSMDRITMISASNRSVANLVRLYEGLEWKAKP
jgi:hypothetical protein